MKEAEADLRKSLGDDWKPIRSYKGDPTLTHVKEPQYLYVYVDNWHQTIVRTYKLGNQNDTYLGKIKLENDE